MIDQVQDLHLTSKTIQIMLLLCGFRVRISNSLTNNLNIKEVMKNAVFLNIYLVTTAENDEKNAADWNLWNVVVMSQYPLTGFWYYHKLVETKLALSRAVTTVWFLLSFYTITA